MKRDWFQIISNTAIIIGLLIVIYEVNQSRTLAQSQLIDSWWSKVNDRELAVLGENPGSALVKAALSPDDLSSEDAAVLDVYYRSVVGGWLDLIRTSDVTGIDRNWHANVQWQARESFTTEPGRRWLKEWAARPLFGDQPLTGAYAQLVEVALEAAAEDVRFNPEKRYRAILGGPE